MPRMDHKNHDMETPYIVNWRRPDTPLPPKYKFPPKIYLPPRVWPRHVEYDPYRSMTELGTGNVLDEGNIRSEIFDSEIIAFRCKYKSPFIFDL